MTHDYVNLTPEQLGAMEREAYAQGDTDRAALLAAVLDLIETGEKLEEVESKLAQLKKKKIPNHKAYKQFFDDCFARLDKHYPCPNVTSDYDQSVIFDAIKAGEAARLDRESLGE